MSTYTSESTHPARSNERSGSLFRTAEGRNLLTPLY